MNDEQNSSKKIQAYLQGFIQFLGSNHGNKYFGTVYEQPDEDYMTAFSTQPVMAASDITAGTTATTTGSEDSKKLDGSHANIETASSNSTSKSRHKKEEETKLMDKLLSAPPHKKMKKITK